MPQRPSVTLKLATSLDGAIALRNGQSRWITGPQSRDAVHQMRANHDCVLTAIGSVLSDDAQMTARPGGVLADKQPMRALVDTRLRLPLDSQFVKAGTCLVFHGPSMNTQAHEQVGAQCHRVDLDGTGRVSLPLVMDRLSRLGISTVMIEAGGLLAASALSAGLVDRLEWFRAPKLMGGEAVSCVAALGLVSLGAAPQFKRTEVRALGEDLWESYERR